MLYLVKAEFIDTGALLFSSERFASVLEDMIIPSFKEIIRLEEERKVLASGAVSGKRAGVFIIDAKSNLELTEILARMPFWSLIKWDITPLESFRDRISLWQQLVENLRQFGASDTEENSGL